MNRISTAMFPQIAITDLGRAQQQLADLARQSSAQTRADDLAGYGRNAQTLVSTQRLVARSEGYLATASELKTRLSIQDTALGRVAEVVSKLKTDLFQGVSLGDGEGIGSRLEEAFAVIKDAMNVQIGGRYLFGGVLSDRPPITATSLSELASTDLDLLMENGAAQQMVRVDEGRVVSTGRVADTIVTDALASIKRLAEIHFDATNGPFGGDLTAVQDGALRAEITSLDAAYNDILLSQSENGRMLADVEDSEARTTDHLAALNSAVGDIVNVDLAEVAVKLNQAKLSYEASASVFAAIKELSLLDVLR